MGIGVIENAKKDRAEVIAVDKLSGCRCERDVMGWDELILLMGGEWFIDVGLFL